MGETGVLNLTGVGSSSESDISTYLSAVVSSTSEKRDLRPIPPESASLVNTSESTWSSSESASFLPRT